MLPCRKIGSAIRIRKNALALVFALQSIQLLFAVDKLFQSNHLTHFSLKAERSRIIVMFFGCPIRGEKNDIK